MTSIVTLRVLDDLGDGSLPSDLIAIRIASQKTFSDPKFLRSDTKLACAASCVLLNLEAVS